MTGKQDNGLTGEPRGDSGSADALYRQATVLYRHNLLDEALLLLTGVVRDFRSHPYAPYLLGMVHMRRGEDEQATGFLRKAIDNKPDEADFHLLLGICLQKLGRSEEAMTAYRKVAELDPANYQSYNNIANILGAAGRYREALEAYDKAMLLHPGTPQIHSNRASLLLGMGRLNEALQACDAALALDPRFALAHSNRGNVLMELNRKEEAESALGAAILLAPELEDARFLLAALREQTSVQTAPAAYVKGLFDGYATSFDDELVGKLHYMIPRHLAEAVSGLLGPLLGKRLDILDIGCGTGLCGEALAGLAGKLVGVDLSPRMLDKARERNIYNTLVESDILQAFETFNEEFDLVLSGDVFIYMGKLDEVFARVYGCLRKNGLFAFSVERLDSGEDYLLRKTARYAHSLAYIERLARENGFVMESCVSLVVRYSGGDPVSGNLYVLRA